MRFIVECWFMLNFVQIVLQTHLNYTANYEESGYDLGDSDENNQTTVSSVSAEASGDTGNLSIMYKFATECETPNHDPGFCIEIKQCPILYKQLLSIDAKDFVMASKCGPNNEDTNNPKVCCGRFDNFRQPKHNIDDNTVFPKKCAKPKVVIMRSRILGGTQAQLGEFPWMARLIHKNDYGYKSVGCSAFLIHTKYVLTAAHCVHRSFTSVRGPVFSVVLGEHNTETKIDCNPMGTHCADPLQISRVAKVIVHPRYAADSSGRYNDIALIHMKRAARITEFVQPICLQTDTKAPVPEAYIISGWGKTEKELFSKIKLKVELPAVSKSVCRDKYSSIDIELVDSQICAGGENGKDSCSGDSGGPLMTENSTDYLAAGVVSYGVGCGNEGWPGVYTYIPSFVPWIKEQIISNSLVGVKSSRQKTHRKKKNGVKKSN